MKQITGNVWHYFEDGNYDAICCTTNYVLKKNGALVMGAGVAKAFAGKYPWLPLNWGKRIAARNLAPGHHPGLFVTLMPAPPHLVYFGTKWHWKDLSDLSLIKQNTLKLMELADILEWDNIILPRPGCSNGGLSWLGEVKPTLDDFLDDRVTILSRGVVNET
jgi:hypothetical protein